MKKKNAKPSHPKETAEKVSKTVWEEYTDMFTMKQKPYNEAFIQRLAQELIEWALNDNKALVLEKFYLSRGISQQTWSRWRKRWPVLDEAWSVAKQAIAVRRETGWITKEYASDITKSMPLYSPKWKKLEEWRASLRANKDEEKNTEIHVHLDNIPDSGIKSRKKDNE